MSKRTAAESVRSKQLTVVDHAMRRAYASSLKSLDLTLLPVETKFQLCTLTTGSMPDTFDVVSEHDEVSRLLGLRAARGTLRQVSHRMYTGPSGKHLELRVSMIASGRPSARFNKRHFSVTPSGFSIGLFEALTAAHRSMSDGELHDLTMKHIASNPEDYFFIGRHTIQFPSSYFDRENVSFLGLPEGTIVPLKNGGLFSVVQRINVLTDKDNNVTGELVLRPLDSKAQQLVDKMRWRSHTAGAFVAPANLYNKQRDGWGFDTANIKIPHVCPLNTMLPKIFKEPSVVAHRIGTAAAPPASGLVWHSDRESLAASLDDFLFG